ncbi:ATP synthase F0 subunit B [Desulfobulbus rhabdoformis]|jgi:F-type H+-transporting ATPase subunit b|uniref:ATP synthase F0 subunit B n=1 Tax=Desulfobulbus rhabdoformis TaxID=34032 RepID=UPI00196272EC|nr:ATP synthase F0 subunit B [Desulfobulbus rhabdoformis]MBM9613418.1 ATP synthase F0 subunit B [Desulfobulbus rhabdoformis]
MISIDVTLLMHIVNMIVLMFVLNAILYKPVLGILEKRAQKIESLNGEVAQFEQNAQQRQAELDQKMREASTKAKKALDGARAQAQAAGAEKLAAIRTESDAMKGKQLADLRSQIDGVRKELEGNAAGFAQAMAGKILGRSLDA